MVRQGLPIGPIGRETFPAQQREWVTSVASKDRIFPNVFHLGASQPFNAISIFPNVFHLGASEPFSVIRTFRHSSFRLRMGGVLPLIGATAPCVGS